MKVDATVRGAAHRSIHHTIRRTEVSDITHIPSRAEFIRDQLAETMTWAGLNAGSSWTPEPTDTGVMHGPETHGTSPRGGCDCTWCAAYRAQDDTPERRARILGGMGARSVAHRVPGTTRTV
jgi:hypothetical protein